MVFHTQPAAYNYSKHTSDPSPSMGAEIRTSTKDVDQGLISWTIFPPHFNSMENSFDCNLIAGDRDTIVHMLQQHSYRDMCKIL